MRLTFDIKPLSVNDAYRRRRFKSKKYEQYIDDIGKLLLFQKKKLEKLDGFLSVKCKWYLKNWKVADVDNPTKPLLDVLKKFEVIRDDKFIMEINIKKIPSQRDYIEIEYNVLKI